MQNGDGFRSYLRSARNLLAGIFALGVVAALVAGRDFLVPVTLAFFIALTFRPLIRRMTRRRIPAWVGAVLFMSVIVAAAIGFVLVLTGPTAEWVARAPDYVEQFQARLGAWRSSFRDFFRLTEQLQQAGVVPQDAPVQEVQVRDNSFFTYLSAATSYSVGLIAEIVLTLVIAAFLMASGDMFYEKLLHIMPTLSDKKQALAIVYDIEREVSGYLLAVTMVNAGLGTVIALGFYAIGMPTPWLWGFLVFALNYVPYVGAITGIGISALISLVTFDSIGYALLAPLFYAGANSLENQFATPWFLGRRLQLNSVAILLSFAFWTWIWGVPGAILAVPLLVTIKIFADHWAGMSAVAEFLSGQDESAAPGEAQGQPNRNNRTEDAFSPDERVSTMPARSKAQQKAAGAALSAKRGQTSRSALKGASREMFADMSEKQLKDIAGTRRKALPSRVRTASKPKKRSG